jgi:transposase InsO family protein
LPRSTLNLLDQDFSTDAPNQKWVCDITYLWTGEGWLDLAVVLDLFSRVAIGWAMDKRMEGGTNLRSPRGMNMTETAAKYKSERFLTLP